MSDHDIISRTIDVRFLLDEISNRVRELGKEYVFPDDIHKAIHDGRVDELRCIAALIKRKMTVSTGNPVNISLVPPYNPNDPNLFIINVPQLLNEVEQLVCCLERQTVFPDNIHKAFHDGRLTEARSILHLIRTQIYRD